MKLCNLVRKIIFLILAAICTNISLAQQWQWARDNKGGGMDGWPVATDDFGNIYCAASSFGGTHFQFNQLLIDKTGSNGLSFVMKYDNSGAIKWVRSSSGSASSPINITTDHSGNVYLLATSLADTVWFENHMLSFPFNNTSPLRKYFLVKIDSSGNVQWVKYAGNCTNSVTTYYSSIILSMGGVACDKNDNIYVTGTFSTPTMSIAGTLVNNSDVSGNTSDFFVAQFLPNGNLGWLKNYGNISNEISLGITVAPNNNIYVTGYFQGNNTLIGNTPLPLSSRFGNSFVACIAPDGNATWAMTGKAQNGSIGIGVTNDPAGNIYLTGAFTDTVVDFNGYSLKRIPLRPVSTFFIDGKITSLFLLQINDTHNIIWAREVNSPNSGVVGFSTAYAKCGQIWVSGCWLGLNSKSLKDTLIIDHQMLESPDSSSDPIFLIGYDLAGNVIGKTALQSGADDQSGIAAGIDGCIYLCSDYEFDGRSFTNFIVGNDTFSNSTQSEYFYLGKFQNKYQPIDSVHNTTIFDTSICKNEQLYILSGTNYVNPIWSTGATTPSITITEPGTFWVSYIWGCANENSSTDTIHVSIKNCFCDFFIPDAFTPNGDNINDKIKPMFSNDCNISNYLFAIYNRWGNLVFSTTNPQERWDGTYKGIPQDSGVFMYYVKFKSQLSGENEFHKGTITLIR